jgi:hypothetical protein
MFPLHVIVSASIGAACGSGIYQIGLLVAAPTTRVIKAVLPAKTPARAPGLSFVHNQNEA